MKCDDIKDCKKRKAAFGMPGTENIRIGGEDII